MHLCMKMLLLLYVKILNYLENHFLKLVNQIISNQAHIVSL